MNDTEKQARIAALQARRAARGMDDPLNRLRALTAAAVANGAPIIVNMPATGD